MTEFERVLIKRDGVTSEEAEQAKNEAHEALYDILDHGGYLLSYLQNKV